MTTIAAVDLGSLTVRLAVAEVTGPGRFRVIRHQREITGLGREVAETGQLGPAEPGGLALHPLELVRRQPAQDAVTAVRHGCDHEQVT